MKLLIVSQYYYPEQFRINDIAEQLVKQGHDVTVVTGIPNYPNGHFYDNYGYLKKRKEIVNGVKIYRSLIVPRGSSKPQLVINYISFIFGGFITTLRLKETFDMIFSFQVSPMFQVLPATWYGKIKKLPTVVYITDLWPETVEYIGNVTNKYVLNFLSKISRYIYTNSGKILVSSEGFKLSIIENSKVNNIEYLPIYAESKYLQKSYLNSTENIFSFVFAGNVGEAQAIENLVYAVSEMDIQHKFEIRIIGDGRRKLFLEDLVNHFKLDDIFKFYGRRNIDDTIDLVISSNVALISLQSNPINSLTLPSKTQSLLSMAMPILVLGQGAVSEVILDAKCGLTASPNDYLEISKQLLEFIKMDNEKILAMSKNSLDFYKKNYTEERFYAGLNNSFNEVTGKNNGNKK